MLNALTDAPEYRDWQWDLAQRLRGGLESVYAGQPDELDCIRALLTDIENTPAGRSSQAPYVHLNVESAYLHGPRSQVKFCVGGIERQRELADLLVLGSFVEQGSLKWQRACLIQAKKEHKTAARYAARFDVDEWQLSLLRAFPAFTGVSGFFTGLTCQLRNHSGMLGAYGLLSAPGDLSVVSARVLHLVLGGRKSLAGNQLVPAILSEVRDDRLQGGVPSSPWWPIDPEHCPECRDVVEHFWGIPWRRLWQHHGHHHSPHSSRYSSSVDQQPASSRLTCLGLDEFVEAWTSLRLGEIWHAGSNVKGDVALRDFILTLVSRVSSATACLGHLRSLIESSADANPPKYDGTDNLRRDDERGGLIILSAVATVEGEG